MAGHSKWHNIQKRKGAQDAKRAVLFGKLAKTITVAAREGGGDPEFNFSLRMAIDTAKGANLPKDKIEAAIARGTGEAGGDQIEEVVYEAFAPGGIALMIQCLTDNRNRTVADIKHLVSKHGGSVGAAGSVAWMFERKGVVAILDLDAIEDRDAFELAVIDAGAEDIKASSDGFRVVCAVPNLQSVLAAVESQGVKVDGAGLEYVPKDPVVIEDAEVKNKLEKLLDALDDNDDVDTVYTNEA